MRPRAPSFLRSGLARLTGGLLVVAALGSLGGVARADEQGDLDKARAAYLARRYDEAERRFRTMLDPVNGTIHDPTLLSRARMYWGAVALAKNSAVQATAIFEKLLLDDPTFEPDPLSFPADVINAFIDTRARMRERLSAMAAEQARRDAERRAKEEAERKRQAEHLAMVERLASEEKITDQHSRWIAALPFGVGQFQNGHPGLGWFFLASEAALTLGGSIALPFYSYNRSKGFSAYEVANVTVANEYLARANTARYVNAAMLGTALGVGAVGILQAELAYVPDVVIVRHRPLPDARASQPSFAPALSPIFAPNNRPSGGQASITVTF
jgi:hypothetical protein